MRRRIVSLCAILIAALSIYVLETARAGLDAERWFVNNTPVTTLSKPNADGPHVVVAHGFAGSREMMLGYGHVLAQAGYRVHLFDFEGHGTHPLPMSGDVTKIEGTTQRLVRQTLDVIEAVEGAEPVALLGHSMATDVLVRVADQHTNTGPLVLLSAFSLAITNTHPRNMLLISGQWEPPLRDFAVKALRMVDADAVEGDTATANGVVRAAKIAPYTEHVAILQSRSGREDALAWLNRAYDRNQSVHVPPTGWAFLGLMAAITALAGPLARALNNTAALPAKAPLTGRQLAAVVAIPMVLTPIMAAPWEFHFLPVLVADYLAVHLGLYGLIMLALIRFMAGPIPIGRLNALAFAALVLWGIGVFGLALDRYGANFFPVPERFMIIAALAIGAIPFMVADAVTNWRRPLWQRILIRIGLLTSLGIAVAIDPERLFFLIMIAPVIVLFFLVHGTMGRAFGKQVGPLTAGLALGLILAWALGVSFPMFSA